jgi:hypothetical protein
VGLKLSIGDLFRALTMLDWQGHCGLLEREGNSDRVPNAEVFCGFSILAVRLSVSLSVYPKQPLSVG